VFWTVKRSDSNSVHKYMDAISGKYRKYHIAVGCYGKKGAKISINFGTREFHYREANKGLNAPIKKKISTSKSLSSSLNSKYLMSGKDNQFDIREPGSFLTLGRFSGTRKSSRSSLGERFLLRQLPNSSKRLRKVELESTFDSDDESSLPSFNDAIKLDNSFIASSFEPSPPNYC
jgi:hypothetical protein